MKRAENLISARICMESKYLKVRMVAKYMNITVRYVKNFLTFNSYHKGKDNMEIKLEDYSSDECIEDTHLDCEGFRFDTKSTIELIGGKVPPYMHSIADGKAIVQSLCSCTCHDRQLMQNDDPQEFMFGYQASLDIWGFVVRSGSEREVEDHELEAQMKKRLSDLY